ncbi:MAG: hypothetical protein WCC37_12260, partial [Candidatus Sulfotelmatobacter sp.]
GKYFPSRAKGRKSAAVGSTFSDMPATVTLGPGPFRQRCHSLDGHRVNEAPTSEHGNAGKGLHP